MDGTGIFAGSNSQAVYSGSIWGDCPVEAIRDGQVPGFLWEKKFNAGQTLVDGAEAGWDGMQQFGSTGAAAVSTPDTTEIGGGQKFGSDGDNEGAGVRTFIQPVKLALTTADFWFEARILSSTIADTKHNVFLGLLENVALTATVPITATGALSDNNFVGFHRTESVNKGGLMSAVYKTDGNTQGTIADVCTLVAGTYTNLGMKFVPKRNYGKGAGYFYWYQDGAQVASYLVTSTAGNPFPNDVFLGFCFAVLNATGTTPGTSSIKHVRMAQLLTALP